MKQCFGYIRVSTLEQSEGVSLAEQKSAIENYAARKGLKIAKWWEETQTAAKKGRSVFDDMVRALERSEAEGLVIHKIDRSARNYHDWATISDLADNGIGIHVATESFDFDTYGGRMATDFIAVVSANYIRNLKAEIHKGQVGQVKRGFYPWRAPIGYLDNGKNKLKTPDPKGAPYVRIAFELYATGEYSLASLREHLNAKGFRNRNGRPLSMCGIETLLKNQFYCGLIHIPKWAQTFKGAHEPLVSVALFRRVQQLKKDRLSKRSTKHNFTYRGIFKCQHCGRSLIGEQQKGRVYYRCHQSACPSNSLREEALDEATIHFLQHLKFDDASIEVAIGKIEQMIIDYGDAPVDQAIKLQLGALSAKMARLTDALIDQLIDKSDFDARKASLLIEQAELEEKATQNEKLAQKAEGVRKILELVKSIATAYELGNASEKRAILKFATSNRVVAAKNVCLEPSNRLLQVENAIGTLLCAQDPGTSRTFGQEIHRTILEFEALEMGGGDSDESSMTRPTYPRTSQSPFLGHMKKQNSHLNLAKF